MVRLLIPPICSMKCVGQPSRPGSAIVRDVHACYMSGSFARPSATRRSSTSVWLHFTADRIALL